MAKILLVEDNEVNRDMLLRRLQRKGYEVVIAVDGEEAIAIARSKHPELILMDISLPGMDDMRSAGVLRLIPKPGISLSSSLRLNPMNPTETAKDSGCVGGNRQAEHGESACYTNSE